MDRNIIAVGFDFGNKWLNLCIAVGGKLRLAKLPTAYAVQRPERQILPSGKEASKLQAFSLPVGDTALWFDVDILSGPTYQKLDDTKYDPKHISILFKAGLYAWSQKHKIDLASLGKLNVMTSMPPGAFANGRLRRLAELAYKKAFNRGQSHFQIDGAQVVTRFAGLQREAVGVIGSIIREKTTTLIVDIGSGTIDYVLYNGGSEPIWAKSTNVGLVHAYADINPSNPGQAELDALRNKKVLHPRIKVHFSDIEQRIVMIRRSMETTQPVEKIVFIGGGSAAMTQPIQAEFKKLAPSVIIKKDAEYQNAIENWRAAGGRSESN